MTYSLNAVAFEKFGDCKDVKTAASQKVQNSSSTTSVALRALVAPSTATASVVVAQPLIASSAKEAVDSLEKLNSLFTKRESPIELSQLHFLSLSQIIDISYILLLLDVCKKLDLNDQDAQAVINVIVLAGKDQKTPADYIQINKHLVGMAQKFNAKNPEKIKNVVLHTLTLSILTKSAAAGALPIQEVKPEALKFLTEVLYEYGGLAIKVHKQIRQMDVRFLSTIESNCRDLKKLLNSEEANLRYSGTSNKKGALKITNLIVIDTKNVSEPLKRLCSCTQTIMENLQRRNFALKERLFQNQAYLDEFIALQIYFSEGFEKRVERVITLLRNYDKAASLQLHGYVSEHSKPFLLDYTSRISSKNKKFFDNLSAKIKAIPGFEEEFRKGTISDLATRFNNTLIVIFMTIYKFKDTIKEQFEGFSEGKSCSLELERFLPKFQEIIDTKSVNPEVAKVVEACCKSLYAENTKIANEIGHSVDCNQGIINGVIYSEQFFFYDLVAFLFTNLKIKTVPLNMIDSTFWTVFQEIKALYTENPNRYDNVQAAPQPSNYAPTINGWIGLIALESIRKKLANMLKVCALKLKESSATQEAQDDFADYDQEYFDDTETETDAKTAAEAPSPSKAKFRGKKKKGDKVVSTQTAVAPAEVLATKKAILLPYISHESRFSALFRHTLGGSYNISLTNLPAALTGKKQPQATLAKHQQLMAVDCVQTVLELQRLLHDPDSKNPDIVYFLNSFLSFYEHLSIEQGMTVLDAEQFPEDEFRTHNLKTMNTRLGLNILVDRLRGSHIGTCRLRYPHSYPADMPTPQDLKNRIKALVGIQTQTLQKYGTVAQCTIPSMDSLWKESEAQSKQNSQLATVALKYHNVSKLKQSIASIEVDKKLLEEKIKKLAATATATAPDNEKTIVLKNVLEHLNNLKMIALIAQTYASERFLFVLAHMGLLSSQYLIENLGVHLSLVDGAKLEKHSLMLYYMLHGLGENLNEEEWKIFKGLNVLKGSEYLHSYFSKRTRAQISPEMDNVCALYGVATEARLSIELGTPKANTLTLDEIQNTLVDHILNQVSVCTSLLSYHLK